MTPRQYFISLQRFHFHRAVFAIMCERRPVRLAEARLLFREARAKAQAFINANAALRG